MSFGGWIKNGVKNFAGSMKNAAAKMIDIPVGIAKSTLAVFPHGKAVTEWVGKRVDNVLKFGEFLVDQPFKLIGGVRKKIKKVIGEKLDERTLERGAHFDHFLAGILLSIVANYGAGPRQMIEGRPLAETRAKVSEKLQTIAGYLNRIPPEPGSDAAIIETEQDLLSHYGSKIEAERKNNTHLPTDSDTTLIASAVGLINSERLEKGQEPLRIMKDLSGLANGRAQFIIDNDSEQPAPFAFLQVPPEQRRISTKTVSLRKEGGKLSLDITPEEEALIIPESVKNNGDGTFTISFRESDASYAQRIREALEKREECQFDDFSLSMDHGEGDYPMNGDPHYLVDKMHKDPQIQQAILSEKNEIGMALSHKGSKMVLSSLLLEEENPDPEKPILTEPIGPVDNMDWYNKIPVKERGVDSIYHKLFYGEPGQPAFDSGLSLFVFYQFKKKIDHLAKTREIYLESVDFHPQEEINNVPYDLLHMKIMINGTPHLIKLMKGTDFVDVPEEGASKNDPKLEKSVGNFMPLNDYFNISHTLFRRKIRDTRIPKSMSSRNLEWNCLKMTMILPFLKFSPCPS
jgi:hypothetical protein